MGDGVRAGGAGCARADAVRAAVRAGGDVVPVWSVEVRSGDGCVDERRRGSASVGAAAARDGRTRAKQRRKRGTMTQDTYMTGGPRVFP